MLLYAIVGAYAPIATTAPKGINTTMANAPRVLDYSMDSLLAQWCQWEHKRQRLHMIAWKLENSK